MMTRIDFEKLEDAFDFVSWSPDYENRAVLDRRTGQFLFQSTADGAEDEDELPEDIDDDPDFVDIPHKNDLDLGRRVAADFAALRMPEDPHVISRIFSGPGAFGRWKVLLEERSLLEEWFDFERDRTRAALREWCEEQGLELEDQER